MFLFLCSGESTRRQPQANSHNRLFGEAARPVATPNKNHFRSNLPFGSDAVDSTNKANGNGKIANGNGHAAANGNGHGAANGNGIAHTNGNGNGVEHGDSNGKVLNGHTNGHKSGENNEQILIILVYSHFNSLPCLWYAGFIRNPFWKSIPRALYTQHFHTIQSFKTKQKSIFLLCLTSPKSFKYLYVLAYVEYEYY